MSEIKKIAVLTSGGDAPGMNAAIRSVVRTALGAGLEVVGVDRGYSGLVYRESQKMNRHSVSNIIQRGGTILKTSRCEEFKTTQGRAEAAKFMQDEGIQGLVAIGGDGTFHGAHYLYHEFGIPVVGVPGTIDNDIYGTDYTIGFDTAVNIAVEAIDKIRDTADAHERQFIVEVMGRHSGFIALDVGIASGAEEVLIPETKTDMNQLAKTLFEQRQAGKTSSIIICAEGEEEGNAFTIAHKINRVSGMSFKVVVLGHIQRGGSPSYRDRILASKLGSNAVVALLDGKSDIMVGEVKGKLTYINLEETWKKTKSINKDLLDLLVKLY
jgi:6-phosphofructokinase 1